MKTTFCTILLATLVLPSVAFADPRHAAPPVWARGTGDWDGHVRQRYPVPPSYELHPPTAGRFYGHEPLPYAWYEDRDWYKDQRKAYKRWRKELERQEKDYKKWRKDVRKQQEKAYKKWRKELEKREKEARKRWRKLR
jgi:hypothetical protein